MSHTHDAPVDKSTISGGLGLTDACFDAIAQDCARTYNEQNCVSDCLLDSGNKIRVEELDVPGHLSRYEKKLLLAGFFIGRNHSDTLFAQSGMKEILGGLFKELGDKSKDQEGED